MNSIIKRSFRDFLSIRFILLAFLPFSISLISLVGLTIYFGADIFNILAKSHLDAYANGDGFIA